MAAALGNYSFIHVPLLTLFAATTLVMYYKNSTAALLYPMEFYDLLVLEKVFIIFCMNNLLNMLSVCIMFRQSLFIITTYKINFFSIPAQ
jgi:hypothetical protein